MQSRLMGKRRKKGKTTTAMMMKKWLVWLLLSFSKKGQKSKTVKFRSSSRAEIRKKQSKSIASYYFNWIVLPCTAAVAAAEQLSQSANLFHYFSFSGQAVETFGSRLTLSRLQFAIQTVNM